MKDALLDAEYLRVRIDILVALFRHLRVDYELFDLVEDLLRLGGEVLRHPRAPIGDIRRYGHGRVVSLEDLKVVGHAGIAVLGPVKNRVRLPWLKGLCRLLVAGGVEEIEKASARL